MEKTVWPGGAAYKIKYRARLGELVYCAESQEEVTSGEVYRWFFTGYKQLELAAVQLWNPSRGLLRQKNFTFFT
jgi:hypothetical protein